MEQEHVSTQVPASPAEAVPGTPGPESSGTQTAQAASASDLTALQARIKELEEQNTRYHSNIAGWEQEAKRRQEENAELQRVVAANEERLRNLGLAIAGQPTQHEPLTPSQALQRFLEGDDGPINQLLSQRSNAAPPTEDVLRSTVNEQLANALTLMQRQNAPRALYPELFDEQSPMRKEILEAYETSASDPTLRLIYGQDEQSLIPIDVNGQQRMYDARLLDRAALRVKERHAIVQQEQQRQAVGNVMPGTGHVGGQQADADPTELFSQTELEQLLDPAVVRAMPKTVERTARGIAAYLCEGMSETEKTRRQRERMARLQGRVA